MCVCVGGGGGGGLHVCVCLVSADKILGFINTLIIFY